MEAGCTSLGVFLAVAVDTSVEPLVGRLVVGRLVDTPAGRSAVVAADTSAGTDTDTHVEGIAGSEVANGAVIVWVIAWATALVGYQALAE